MKLIIEVTIDGEYLTYTIKEPSNPPNHKTIGMGRVKDINRVNSFLDVVRAIIDEKRNVNNEPLEKSPNA